MYAFVGHTLNPTIIVSGGGGGTLWIQATHFWKKELYSQINLQIEHYLFLFFSIL